MTKPSAILMGSKPGSVVALSIMLQRGWDIRYVVVSRKHQYPWIAGPTLEQVALQHGLHVLTQPELPDTLVDFVISYMFRYRVKSHVLKMARRAALNFHAGPLPEYGGWAFYNVAILDRATEYGCTCHYMDDGFDTGPLLKVRRFPICAAQETAYSLERLAQQEMTCLFVDFCRLAESGQELPIEPQDRTKMRYLSQEEFDQLKVIPPGADADTIDRYARAFWYPPYKGAYTMLGTTRVEIIPQTAKEEVARHLHGDDLAALQRIAERYMSENM